MVRNEEMPEVGQFARAVAQVIKDEVADAGLSGSEVGRRLGRAQSYASTRLNGRKAWTLDELDRLAAMLSTTVDALMAKAQDKR